MSKDSVNKLLSPITHVFLRSPYNYDRDVVSRDTGLSCNDKSRTQQQFKDQNDVNVIMKKFANDPFAVDPMVFSRKQARYGDFTGAEDFHATMNRIIAAEEAFMALPSAVRSKFENDPAKLLEFINNSDNYDEAVKLGLIDRKEDSPAPQQGKGESESHGNASFIPPGFKLVPEGEDTVSSPSASQASKSSKKA